MSKVRSKDTKPETDLRRALHALGVRGYRLHRKDIPGKPDIAWIGRRVAVFVDGAFWHGHPSAFTPGASGDFWDRKIIGNMERDRRVDDELRRTGWEPVRIWDFEVKEHPEACAERIRSILATRPLDRTARAEEASGV